MMRGDATLNRPFADDADTALKRFGQISPSSSSRLTLYYLVDMREKTGAHLDEGGDLAEAYYDDQSAYAQLDTFDELATDNSGVVFEHMESTKRRHGQFGVHLRSR